MCLDDAGAGLSTIRQIAQLRPDFIKLDIALIRQIDKDKTSQAVASLMRRCAVQTGTVLISKGIETEAQLSTLLALGVRFGQGFLLGSPGRFSLCPVGCGPPVHAGPLCEEVAPRSLDHGRSHGIIGYPREPVRW